MFEQEKSTLRYWGKVKERGTMPALLWQTFEQRIPEPALSGN